MPDELVPRQPFDPADYDGSMPANPQAEDYYPNDGSPRRGRKLMHVGLGGWWDIAARERVRRDRDRLLDQLADALDVPPSLRDTELGARAPIRVEAEVGEPIREIESGESDG